MILYHCTTPKKYEKYKSSGRIFQPVRGFNTEKAAEEWCRHTGRTIIVTFSCDDIRCYPLPDHKQQDGRAYWTDEEVKIESILEIKNGVNK